MWFKNRRAKFRKKQRAQKLKDSSDKARDGEHLNAETSRGLNGDKTNRDKLDEHGSHETEHAEEDDEDGQDSDGSESAIEVDDGPDVSFTGDDLTEVSGLNGDDVTNGVAGSYNGECERIDMTADGFKNVDLSGACHSLGLKSQRDNMGVIRNT